MLDTSGGEFSSPDVSNHVLGLVLEMFVNYVLFDSLWKRNNRPSMQ